VEEEGGGGGTVAAARRRARSSLAGGGPGHVGYRAEASSGGAGGGGGGGPGKGSLAITMRLQQLPHGALHKRELHSKPRRRRVAKLRSFEEMAGPSKHAAYQVPPLPPSPFPPHTLARMNTRRGPQ
jgi:hypothetical protein